MLEVYTNKFNDLRRLIDPENRTSHFESMRKLVNDLRLIVPGLASQLDSDEPHPDDLCAAVRKLVQGD